MNIVTHKPMRDVIAAHDVRSPEDVQRARKGLFAESLQAMLDDELETHLGYPKHQAGPQPTSESPVGDFRGSPPQRLVCQAGQH